MLNGVILRRQAEGVPSDRIQHVITFHPPLSGDDVNGCVAARMADMQSRARRVGKLDQAVELRLAVIILGGKCLLFIPDLLPLFFDDFRLVRL